MKFLGLLLTVCLSIASATILQNGQVRPTNYPDTSIAAIPSSNSTWKTFGPNATELAYKGRWDSQYISWWSAPGLKFSFLAQQVAISFGQYTSPGVLVAYRLDGQDWQFTNVTANSTNLLVTPSSLGYNLTAPGAAQTLEVRVTNWALGIQIAGVHLSGGASRLVPTPSYGRVIEVIGDSLSSGYTDTLEGLSSYAWGLAYGLGGTEFSITAFPGICVTDAECFGNPRGQSYQWNKIVDTSSRAVELYGDNPPLWDFAAHPAADITIINIGTNDNNTANNVTSQQYTAAYIDLINQVHAVWPDTQIIVQSLWSGWYQIDNTWAQANGFLDEIQEVVKHFNNGSLNQKGGNGFVYYFNTTGIMQHNDDDPAYHPTDVGHVKVASHLMQYIKLIFDWPLLQTGPEVQHDTLYWNDEQSY